MGEKLSFYKLVSEKNYTIEIPIVQRDYAQGRESAEEIRSQFLLALKNYLDANKPIELDFIYGSLLSDSQKTLFIPLDGQQRLTTLFLLHWYLAVKENRLSDFRKVMTCNLKGKFSYETRITSRDFCNALISNDFNFDNISSTTLSYQIKDSSWFFLSWQNDPTILSMLVVIDDIHNIFSSAEGHYDKLIDGKDPIICFQFIELKNFGLSDSLYVKMNSRGKELTEFENFKARFEQHIEKLGNEKGNEIKAEFSKKIDTDWTDLFWNYRDTTTNVFDSQLMNFIRVLATNNYSLRQITNYEIERDVRVLIDKTKKVSFAHYDSLKCLDITCLNDIVKTLDYLKNGSDKIKIPLHGMNIIDERDLFDDVVKNELNYKDRVLFFAYYKYLIVNNGDTVGLFDWMRIIRNLSVNTIYNDANGFARSIKAIRDLLNSSSGILQYLSVITNKVEGFAEIQIFEERIKAILLLKGDEWRESILKYEKHKYFLGQIDFILKFSGIKDYYKINNNLSWDNTTDERFYKLFNQYAEKASVMFTDSGLNQLDKYLWQRALLSKNLFIIF
jgi:hypothetical protein